MTKRSPLAPGDKVVFYNNGFRYHGEVVRLYTAGKIQVRSINGNEYDIHEKQCRRLIPKPRKEKQERRCCYVFNSSLEMLPKYGSVSTAITEKPFYESRHMTEIHPGETICPPGSVSVSREKLIAEIKARTVHWENIMEALGLPKEGA